MTRRALLIALFIACLPRLGCRAQSEQSEEPMSQATPDKDSIQRLDVEHARWKSVVAPEAYAVMFEEATEAPFSHPLNDEKRAGTYVCAACRLPLFESSAKFNSGTGWPSFFRAIDGSLGTKRDFRLLVPRTEYHCIRCGSHQGHVFKDGPPPTGLRYCNNGLALEFVPEGEPLPELRTP